MTTATLSMLRGSLFPLLLVFVLLWSSVTAQQRRDTSADRFDLLRTDPLLPDERPQVSPSVPADEHWDARFGIPGVNGEVDVITVDGDWLYLGGKFTLAGSVQANRIARYNRITHQWQSLGEAAGNGTDGMVLAIAVQGEKVYVGGQFSLAGGIEAHNIAVWNSTTDSWSAFGEGSVGDASAYVASILVRGSDLYIGGRFTAIGTTLANNIARWDGSSWERLGAGLDRYVFTMALDGEDLYVGGAFTTAGGKMAKHIAVWNGTSWSALDQGFDNDVMTLALYRGDIHAGGRFHASGDSMIRCVARWNRNDGRWERLGDPGAMTPGVIYSIIPRGDSLFVGGSFQISGIYVNGHSLTATNFALWNGRSWRTIQAREDSTIIRGVGPTTAISVYALASTVSEIYIAGLFATTSSYPLGAPHAATNIVGWNFPSQRWITLGQSVDGAINSLLAVGGDIYAGGSFLSAGGISTPAIARWDGSHWNRLGTGIDGGGYYSEPGGAIGGARDDGYVTALLAGGNGIYAGGSFSRAGEVLRRDTVLFPTPVETYRAINIARWNGSRWDSLASLPDIVGALAEYRNELYATSGSGVFRWNGTAWSPFPSAGYFNGTVNALAFDQDGNLYVGGAFGRAGELVAEGIVRWDRANDRWSALGGGVDDAVLAIATDGEKVYVGGRFLKAGGIDAQRIAVWDDAIGRWASLGRGIDRDNPTFAPHVRTIATGNGKVYIGGWFDVAGDRNANNVAVWDGETWSTLGSGVDSIVNTIIVNGDDLYLGGAFSRAGSVPSFRFAHWNAATASVNPAGRSSQPLVLLQNIPNPFSTTTTIRFRLPQHGRSLHAISLGEEERVHLSVHDLLGREVASLIDGEMETGEHSITFNASGLPSGIYFYRLQSGESVRIQRMIVR
jgi:hypothetical protein